MREAETIIEARRQEPRASGTRPKRPRLRRIEKARITMSRPRIVRTSLGRTARTSLQLLFLQQSSASGYRRRGPPPLLYERRQTYRDRAQQATGRVLFVKEKCARLPTQPGRGSRTASSLTSKEQRASSGPERPVPSRTPITLWQLHSGLLPSLERMDTNDYGHFSVYWPEYNITNQ